MSPYLCWKHLVQVNISTIFKGIKTNAMLGNVANKIN